MAGWQVIQGQDEPISTEWRIDKTPTTPETSGMLSGSELARDVGQAAARGTAKGTAGLIGAPGDIVDMAAAAPEYLMKKGLKATGLYPDATDPTFSGIMEENRNLSKGSTILPRSRDIEKQVIEPATGADLGKKPSTTAGKYVQSIAEFAPQAVIGGGGLIPRAASVIGGGVGSEALGSLTEGTSAEPWARFAGGTLGALGQRAVTPVGVPADRAPGVAILEHEGVRPTAGQRTGSAPLQYAEDHLGQAFMGPGNPAQRPLQEFTGAVMGRIGMPGQLATTENLNHAYNTIGGEINALGQRNTLIRDRQFTNDIHDAYQRYTQRTSEANRVPHVDQVYEDLVQMPAVVPGNQYTSWRSDWARDARATNNDPNYRYFLNSVNRALDNAMERSVAVVNPQDLGSFRDARNRYRNLMLIEHAVKTGEGGARGYVTPERLRSAITSDEYVYGTGDFGDLAKAGKAVLTSKPDSGTGARVATHAIPASAAVFAGHGDPTTFMAATAAPAIAGHVINSRPVQAYLSNNIFDQANMVSPLDATVRASLASRAHDQTK